METAAAMVDRDLSEMTIDEQEALWSKAKEREQGS